MVLNTFVVRRHFISFMSLFQRSVACSEKLPQQGLTGQRGCNGLCHSSPTALIAYVFSLAAGGFSRLLQHSSKQNNIDCDRKCRNNHSKSFRLQSKTIKSVRQYCESVVSGAEIRICCQLWETDQSNKQNL